MTPSLSILDLGYNGAVYSVAFGQYNSRLGTGADSKNDLFGDLCVAVFAAPVQAKHLALMRVVFGVCDPLQVVNRVVRFVSVLVVDLGFALRVWQERVGDKAVDQLSACFAVFAQHDKAVAIPVLLGRPFASGRAHRCDTPAPLELDYSLKPEDAPGVVNLIEALVAGH